MGLFKKNVTVTKSLAMSGKESGAIVGTKGFLLGRIIRMEGNKEIIIGSDSTIADVVIDKSSVENKHCSVKYIQEDKNYIVCNLSEGDLIADGEDELEQGKCYTLQPGTKLSVGSFSDEIRLG